MSVASVEPGIYRGLSFAAYCAIPAVNASSLNGYNRSPMHARHAQLHRHETAAMRLGSALHAALLEPERYATRYVQRQRFAGKGSREANRQTVAAIAARGLVELTEDERDACDAMRRAVLAHPISGPLVRDALALELTAVWLDEETGAPCKLRADLVSECDPALLDTSLASAAYTVDGVRVGYATVVVDIKTTDDASAREWQRSVLRYGYHRQAAWYLSGLAALGMPASAFVFVVVESVPPHGVAVYELSDELLQHGHDECRRALALRLECERTQSWPGYPAEITTTEAPRWLR